MSRARGRLVALGLAAVLCGGWKGCRGSGGLPLPPEAEHHFAPTADGYALSLVRYAPRGAPRGRPVLLVHGVAANDRSLDLDAGHSLPRWLAAHGREAWTLSLRGTGDSQGPDPERGRKGPTTFDSFWQKDLPTAIDFVRAQTHAERIDYIGHSMGGMLVYAFLAEGGQGLGAAVTLGSPTRLDWGASIASALIRSSSSWVASDDDLPVAALAALVPFQGQVPANPVEKALYNPRNVDLQTWQRLLEVGVDNISGGVALQFIRMMQGQKFQSADGKLDFRRDMARIRTPVLVVAGKLDRTAFTPAVKDGYRALGGPKQWLLAGEEDGVIQDDYGHMDLVLGSRASTELWPRVLDFLDRHGDAPNPVVSSPAGP